VPAFHQWLRDGNEKRLQPYLQRAWDDPTETHELGRQIATTLLMADCRGPTRNLARRCLEQLRLRMIRVDADRFLQVAELNLEQSLHSRFGYFQHLLTCPPGQTDYAVQFMHRWTEAALSIATLLPEESEEALRKHHALHFVLGLLVVFAQRFKTWPVFLTAAAQHQPEARQTLRRFLHCCAMKRLLIAPVGLSQVPEIGDYCTHEIIFQAAGLGESCRLHFPFPDEIWDPLEAELEDFLEGYREDTLAVSRFLRWFSEQEAFLEKQTARCWREILTVPKDSQTTDKPLKVRVPFLTLKGHRYEWMEFSPEGEDRSVTVQYWMNLQGVLMPKKIILDPELPTARTRFPAQDMTDGMERAFEYLALQCWWRIVTGQFPPVPPEGEDCLFTYHLSDLGYTE
jgi:hypothetical protein